MMLPPAVNFHLYKPCNARCRFCFATFGEVNGHLGLDDARGVIAALREAGAEKLTFVGGEPTLHPHLGELLRHAKQLGLVTCVVTNGARFDTLLDRHAEDLDWVGLSVDSADDATQALLGRGHDVPARALRQAERAHTLGVRVKLNTVVTSLTWREDMSDYVRRLAPARWKALQVLPVGGQNDGLVDDLLIDAPRFDAFVLRHAHLATEGLAPVAEPNDAMRGSYAMVNPLGQFYGNATGRHVTSAPILDVGVAQALAEVGFVYEKLVARGGVYAW